MNIPIMTIRMFFSDFGRTAGFVNNIYSYLDSDLPGINSLASACDEAEMAITWSSVLDYTNGNWTAMNPKSQWGNLFWHPCCELFSEGS